MHNSASEVPRLIQKKIEADFFKGKVIIIYGARQVGKTTLAKALLSNFSGKKAYFNCDEPDIRSSLMNKTSTELKQLVGDAKLVVFDEAQRVENIGITLKLLVDTYPSIQIIATGSLSFELANTISEPLTGRTFQYTLYPLSELELRSQLTDLELKRTLETRLRFGNYPEIFTQNNLAEKERLLNALKSDYLLQDILKFENVKGSDILYKLLQLLALQVGSEVSFSELAKTLEINKGTVKKYIDILEKGFIIFKLSAFSRNLRVEISKKNKIYFYDVGLRNALISNHNPIDLRLDKGFIWENYMISERIKFNSYTRNYANLYFWRTYNQKELDLVEEKEGQLFGYEFKLTKDKMGSSKTFLKSYPNSNLSLVNRDNFLDFVT